VKRGFLDSQFRRVSMPWLRDRIIDQFLQYALASFIHAGDFRVAVARGGSFRVGDGVGKPLAIRFKSTSAELAVLLDPDLRFAESYVDGDIVVEQG
jgi:cyclopropane-fatty-acyl-phospholipid synthase